MSGLYFKGITDDEFEKVVGIVRGERTLDDVSEVDGKLKQYDVKGASLLGEKISLAKEIPVKSLLV